ncbi:dihydrofolate reductase family protein [Chelativorans sp. SCAU2101]|jgi:Dihydrofolate reductase|uniref:Dihydrofolate reductase family protein n=1 Tax=Chelativorans petroleitrophicus TaxID=2975484 RepID=A0A9X2XCQ6_9HYPH|nr:dihydrofolate reductase family protein [Chelativorans petroleitrophicus]MCT8992205.1 dihydrofolate reductase family protein [Chelativorans petroleitrophicus]
MRRLISAVKISLDGKIEGPDGYADWVKAWSEDYGLTPQIDACLLGGGMYPGYEQYWTAMQRAPDEPLPMTGQKPTAKEIAWAKLIPELPHYVLSSTLKTALWPNTRFLRGVDEVAQLKNLPGKDIYLVGGAQVASCLIDAGLVDEIRLIVHPLLAGAGKSHFEGLDGRKQLELSEVRQLENGLVYLRYGLI